MPPKKTPVRHQNDSKIVIIVILTVVVGILCYLLVSKDDHRLPAPDRPAFKKVVKRIEPLPVVPAPRTKLLPKKVIPGTGGKIAFILDDWGYSTRNCKYLKAIRRPLAIAILPNLRHSQDISKCSSEAGKDIMLHLPLEPYQNNDTYPDNYLITITMKPSQVVKLLEDSLTRMPQAIGVNNHMGSRATENSPLIKLIFKRLKNRRLFFVDSLTSQRSICAETAKEVGLPFAQRDVFLDNNNTKDEIEKQIVLLAQKARKHGSAIAIGHDRDLTLRVIKEQIPLLEAQGFEIVSIKDLVNKP